MNYYIQGNAAKADQIRAAFESKEIRVPHYRSCGDNSLIYFSLNKEVLAVTIKALELFEDNPDYKELELPVEPKFKVGDWIVGNEGIFKITQYEDEHGYDLIDTTGCVVHFVSPDYVESNYHLWTIADAKDGDVLALNGKPFIYSYEFGHNYCYIDNCGQFRVNFNLVLEGNCVHPAVKEQRDLLFKKMREVGYTWDENKKELKKIPKHYDIANFQPFDKVLVRDCNHDVWRCSWFSHYNTKEIGYPFVTTSSTYKQCIPFEGNEYLLGTTDMPSEEYINW